jgi:hypothetical protein
MATKTQFICDRCGKSQDDDQQFWLVGIMVTTTRWITTAATQSLNHRCEWCRKCVEEFGILPKVETRNVPTPEVPLTIEDMIREIVRLEIAS